jgi:hypothetical protein
LSLVRALLRTRRDGTPNHRSVGLDQAPGLVRRVGIHARHRLALLCARPCLYKVGCVIWLPDLVPGFAILIG